MNGKRGEFGGMVEILDDLSFLNHQRQEGDVTPPGVSKATVDSSADHTVQLHQLGPHYAGGTLQLNGIDIEDGASLDYRMLILKRMVMVLNEAQGKVVGHANYLHWPLLFAADPETTDIECFMQGDSPTTNLLGVLNGALAFTDSEGIRHRISYSSDDARYTVASTLENTGT